MKTTNYTVAFTNHCFENVSAFNVQEAAILAMAEQIKKGHSYNICFIRDEDSGRIYHNGWQLSGGIRK